MKLSPRWYLTDYPAEFHGLSCVHVQASWYSALLRVSLCGVGFRCVGVLKRFVHAGKGQATRAPMFSPCYLFIVVFLFSFLYCRACIFFFVQLVPSDSEVGDEKSVLTRTKTLSITICFKEVGHMASKRKKTCEGVRDRLSRCFPN